MKTARSHSRQSGFTLIEMAAAMLGVFLVVGAATGFLLTAMLRQAAVLQASALEDQHEELAEIMVDTIKSAVDLQIYQALPTNTGSGPLTPGNPSGDYLVCVNQDGTREFHFDGVQIEYQFTGNGVVQKRIFAGVSVASKDDRIFNSNQGILQAQWNVNTTVDQVPFNVFGVPLQMQ